jgi:hypothetical protein
MDATTGATRAWAIRPCTTVRALVPTVGLVAPVLWALRNLPAPLHRRWLRHTRKPAVAAALPRRSCFNPFRVNGFHYHEPGVHAVGTPGSRPLRRNARFTAALNSQPVST